MEINNKAIKKPLNINKRRDALRACDWCQKRKTRCIIGNGACQACTNRKIPCRFDNPVRKRGPKTKEASHKNNLENTAQTYMAHFKATNGSGIEKSNNCLSSSDSFLQSECSSPIFFKDIGLIDETFGQPYFFRNFDLHSYVNDQSLKIEEIFLKLTPRAISFNITQNEILLISSFFAKIYPTLSLGQSNLKELNMDSMLIELSTCQNSLVRSATIYSICSLSSMYLNFNLNGWNFDSYNSNLFSNAIEYNSKAIALLCLINEQPSLLFSLIACCLGQVSFLINSSLTILT